MINKRAFSALLFMNIKELIRNPLTFFMVLAFPFLFLIMFGVLSSSTGVGTDLFEFIIPGIIVMAFFTLAINGTSTPIIQMRDQGTLRLIGLTEASKLTFVLSQICARFVLAAFQLVALLSIAYFNGMLQAQNIPQIMLVSLIGLLMLFALGYTVGSMRLSIEAVNGLSGGMLAPLLIVCGLIMPMNLLPSWLETVSKFIPLTYFGELLRYYLNGDNPSLGVLFSYLILIASTALLAFAAVRLFRWDNIRG
ncbi:ABC transporter [Bacillus subtilis]|nr:ABC transporter [Bacillus subtilis]OBA01880.1 ABC transporter [Bacillus subtilis]